MEDQLNTRLQAEAERIVHPVHGMYDTKLKMREDLYGHLLGLYEEERQKNSNENKAIQAAVQRLGNPDELRAHLQKSVHWFERLNWYMNLEFLPFFRRAGLHRREETDWRRAARMGSIHAVIFLAVYGVFAGAILYLGPAFAHGPLGVSHPYLGALWVAGTTWVLLSVVHLVCPWILDRAEDIGRRSLRWYLITAIGGVFLLSCGICQIASIAVAFDGSFSQRMGAAELCFVAGILLGRLMGCQFQTRRSEEWLSLSVPEAAARPNGGV